MRYRTIIDKETGELKRVGVAAGGQPPAASTWSPTKEEVDQISAIPSESLRTLVLRILSQQGLITCMSEEQTAQAILDRLASFALTHEAKEAITAGREWFDRKQGKPMQKQQTIITQTTLAELVELSMQKTSTMIDATPLTTFPINLLD